MIGHQIQKDINLTWENYHSLCEMVASLSVKQFDNDQKSYRDMIESIFKTFYGAAQ